MPKKIPMRTCIGCGTSKPKKELIRIVLTDDGEILADRTGRANGRGKPRGGGSRLELESEA